MKWMYLLLVVLSGVSCSNEDKVDRKGTVPGIYAHYDISAEDGNTMAICLVRYYTDRSRKTTLEPGELRNVELDGEDIHMDSTRFSGVFYETQIPVSDFEGQHTIAFTGKNNYRYEEKFSFVPMVLHTDLSEPVSKTNLVLELEGILPGEKVRLVMIDTAFDSQGVNQVETVKNGKLIVGDKLLSTLKSGPIILEISKESETPLTSGLDGVLTATYTIRRSFLLKD
jgi:hypothetical protein